MATARRRARMATMITRLMLVRPTDIGDLITSLTACSSESDPGTAGASGVASMGAVTLTGDLMAAASMGGASTAGASMVEGSRTAGASERRADADLAAAVAGGASNHVVVAASVAVVVADSTAAVAADSTVAADMAVEDIAKT
jgi:hypothetical protein